MRKLFLAVFVLLAFTFQPLFGAGGSERRVRNNATSTGAGRAKYVFVFVGDGMSTSHFSAAEYYLSTKNNVTNYNLTRLNFTQFPSAGLSNTHDYGSLITDSASAGTAFASGRKTLSSMINIDPKDGKTRA